ncbi:OX-2 membrane glycoprotein-like isoform X3 [Choloepus didactylus]|uniref:OX-2 membrane glycoprotein-like isoform X3 n=1 Tax=Choloepus didactylus TaxID=27675 RepID=UPI00189E5BAA|nr:OX-2 membrane glycoprotein-like isoform X3 [Choloepus didactylus]
MERRVLRRLFRHLSTYRLIWGMAAVVLCRAQGTVVTQDEKVLLHTPASLKCSLQTSQEVLIVTWQKIKATSPENMVTFSWDHGVVVQPSYKDKVNITQLGLRDSTITFWNTTLEDEGCYKCLFNTFGSGQISRTACLTLYVQPTASLHYKFSEDHLNITCSATARPAPVISWKVAGSGIENSTESLSHPNGTTSVTSILQVKDPKSQVGKEVICKVLHLGSVTTLRKTMNKGIWFSVPLLLSIVSLVILLVLISILLYWKRHRNQDRAVNITSFPHNIYHRVLCIPDGVLSCSYVSQQNRVLILIHSYASKISSRCYFT